jgi:demethylmenaquinone methyltransferase/2-methoxy-6-polyprenyl-1,4-benzoquinol methylase
MTNVRASTDADRHPVIYAGRFGDQLAGADLPVDSVVLAERDALPHKLTGVLDHANTLVFLDLLSFPFEVLTGGQWDIPMIAVLPSGVDAGSLTSDFGPVLFERLGFFDRIVAPDSAAWDELRRRYRWAESQRIPVASDHPSEVTKTVRNLLAGGASSPTTSETCSTDRDPRLDKALHRVQAAALEPRFAAARGKQATEVPLDVLEVCTGAGRWASSFDPMQTRFVGIDAREDLVESARANFPEGRFDRLGPDLLFPYEDEGFDLVFSVAVMHHNPAPAKRTMLSEMWRVCRPGGGIVFLEDFVFAGEPEETSLHPTSVTKFVDLILEATTGQVVLDYTESLRYPGEELHTGGLISLLRLGVPKA